MSSNTPTFWRSVTVDSMVTLTDKITLESSYESGEGYKGKMYTVARIVSVVEEGGSEEDMQHIFFALDHPEEENQIWLMVKIVANEDVAILVLGEMPHVLGDRVDLAVEHSWVFDAIDEGASLGQDDITGEHLCDLDYDETDIIDQIDVLGLRFTPEMFHTFDVDGEDVEFDYEVKDEFYGCTHDNMLATVVEYECDDDRCEENQCVILEVGCADNKRGGLIRMMTGAGILATEVDVIVH